ncbi:C40 family peptidase [Levilactobacillus huananensis]|uniref:C40 family peptidase n=1 Tax=Levilactobacillus huananensis TaxID=2486019 RepID=UPI002989D388|nr:C40 family peptidase [Levilactobacillus huananensis]
MNIINTTTVKILIGTLGAAAMLLAGTQTASAHMTTSTPQTQTTQVTTATTGSTTNTSYTHTSGQAANTVNTATTSNASGAVAKALSVAKSGVPYVYGGSSLSGFDCSGLVQYAFGLSARTTYQQTTLGTHHYDVANAPAGAILFWGSESAPYHDGISLGNGQYVAAQNENDGIGVFSQTYWAPSYYITLN